MKFCRDEYDTEKGLYRCAECGSEMPSPTIRQCPFAGVVERESKTVNYLTCPHRGQVLATINGRVAGCGCSSTRIEVYECRYFHEPVIKQGHPPCLDTLREQVPGATGRTCRECKVPSQERGITILHITFRPGWQDQIRRSGFALAAHGRQVTGVEIVRPDRKKLEHAIKTHRPRLVLNHGFCLRYDSFLPVVESHPDTKFVTIDHSNQNHTFTWPTYFTDEKNTLEATTRMRNLWYSSPDAFGPWNELGYDRYVHWPNPVCLHPSPPVPSVCHAPPVLAIVGRCDWMKALPVQVAAAALVQRRRPLKVAFVLRDSEERQKGLREHARACKLDFEVWPWSDMEGWERRLRDECDVVSQSTFSDSFNYVSLDAAAFGKPFVGSWAIRHTPAEWRVDNPNDTYEVAAKIEWILDNYPAASTAARSLAERVAAENNQAYAETVRRIMDGRV